MTEQKQEKLAPNIFGWPEVSKFVDPSKLTANSRTAYCTLCQNTFSTAALFDKHRVHDRNFKSICNYPGKISKTTGLPTMIIGKRGIWIGNIPGRDGDEDE